MVRLPAQEGLPFPVTISKSMSSTKVSAKTSSPIAAAAAMPNPEEVLARRKAAKDKRHADQAARAKRKAELEEAKRAAENTHVAVVTKFLGAGIDVAPFTLVSGDDESNVYTSCRRGFCINRCVMCNIRICADCSGRLSSPEVVKAKLAEQKKAEKAKDECTYSNRSFTA